MPILRIAQLLNSLYGGGAASLGGAFALLASLMGTTWKAATALGASPGMNTVTFVVIFAVVVTLTVALIKPARWMLLEKVLSHSVDRLLPQPPDLLVGIGPGGAIIAGILAKQLSDRRGQEPLVGVINRQFKWEGKDLLVLVQTASSAIDQPAQLRILLVTPEVHTGNTIKAASAYLTNQNIKHDTYSLITSPTAATQIKHSVLVSDRRGLLPWSDAPGRSVIKSE